MRNLMSGVGLMAMAAFAPPSDTGPVNEDPNLAATAADSTVTADPSADPTTSTDMTGAAGQASAGDASSGAAADPSASASIGDTTDAGAGDAAEQGLEADVTSLLSDIDTMLAELPGVVKAEVAAALAATPTAEADAAANAVDAAVKAHIASVQTALQGFTNPSA